MAVHTVALPDGRSIDFPASMSDADINSAVQKEVGAKSSNPPMPTGGTTALEQQLNTEAEPWKKVSTLSGIIDQAKQVPGAFWQGIKNIPQGLAGGGKTPLETLFKIGVPAIEQGSEAKDLWNKGGAINKTEAVGRAATVPLAAVGGNWLASKGEQAGRGDVLPAAAEVATTLAAPSMAKAGLNATAAFRSGLLESSHGLLNKAADSAKRQLSDVRQNVTDHVGKLVKDIAAADYSDKPAGSIPLGDLIPEMDKLATAYKGEGQVLPVFDKFRQRIESIGPTASWFDVQKLRSEFGQALNSARSAKDVGSSSSLYQSLTDKLSDRAGEIGREKQFQSYNQTYSKLMQYQNDGVLGKLLNAPTGKDFFDALKAPVSGMELKGLVKDLSQYGLPENWRGQLLSDHKGLYDYVSNAGGTSGIGGKFKAIRRHPIAGGAGLAVGAGLGTATGIPGGSFLGGFGGAVGAASMVDRIRAAKNMSQLGGAPEVSGAMGDRVEPVNPNAETPQPTQGAVSKGDLVSALKSLGYSKEAATAAALQSLKTNPPDFDTALRNAMKR